MRNHKLAQRLLAVTAALAALATANASDTPIGPGSVAPKIEVKTWLKGTPVKDFEAGKTYVVEFWATWCGPCLQSIPHVTELARKNKDVTFIGVSIWEDEEGDKLPKFVAEMGDKMDYNVGYSGNKEGMATTWMEAAGQNGIPAAFVVKDNKIQWIGHPMELDKPLAEIKAGTFDSVAFKADFEKQAEANRKMMAANREFNAAGKLHDEGKTAEAKAKLDAVVAENPDFKTAAERMQYDWLATDDPAAFEATNKSYLDSGDPDKIVLVAGYALQKAQEPEGAEVSRKLIGQVVAANKKDDYLVLNYARNVYLELGDNKEALAITNKMIELFPNSPAKDSPQFKDSLLKSKADLEAKIAGKS